MKTLMRNGRDRRSENPFGATRGKNACFCLGPISGSHQGQRPQRLHSKAGYMAAPERFAKTSEFLLHRGRRPYMASSWHRERIAHLCSPRDLKLATCSAYTGMNRRFSPRLLVKIWEMTTRFYVEDERSWTGLCSNRFHQMSTSNLYRRTLRSPPSSRSRTATRSRPDMPA
jgi:hypothetical protein